MSRKPPAPAAPGEPKRQAWLRLFKARTEQLQAEMESRRQALREAARRRAA
jgi:hypothetical protein